MKKLILFLSFSICSIAIIKAQKDDRIFKRFKGDVSLGYALPTVSNLNGGILFAMEPKFALMDRLSVGLRMEGAVMARFSGSLIGGDADADNAKAVLSYLATADYYFSDKYSFRPFAGAGAGIVATADDNTSNYYGDADYITFGGLIRAGAEVKHFRFGIEYNIIPSGNVSFYNYDNAGNLIITSGKLKNGYVGIKVGFCFGGGPR